MNPLLYESSGLGTASLSRQQLSQGVSVERPTATWSPFRTYQQTSPWPLRKSADTVPARRTAASAAKRSLAGALRAYSLPGKVSPSRNHRSHSVESNKTGRIWPSSQRSSPEASLSPRPRSSSNYNEVLRSRTPKFFNKLRSLSSNRVVSAKATYRPANSHDLESSTSPGCPSLLLPETPESEYGSSTEASYDPEPFMPLGYDGFRRRSSRQAGSPLSAIAESNGHVPNPYILVPHISITPDIKRVENDCTMV